MHLAAKSPKRETEFIPPCFRHEAKQMHPVRYKEKKIKNKNRSVSKIDLSVQRTAKGTFARAALPGPPTQKCWSRATCEALARR